MDACDASEGFLGQLDVGIVMVEMRHHVLHHRLHFFQVGESGLHFIVKGDAERVGGEVFQILHRIRIVEVAAEEHAITVLYFHQFLLEIGRVEVEEHVFVTVELEVVRLGFDVEFGFVGRCLILARYRHEREDDDGYSFHVVLCV